MHPIKPLMTTTAVRNSREKSMMRKSLTVVEGRAVKFPCEAKLGGVDKDAVASWKKVNDEMPTERWLGVGVSWKGG